MGFMPNDEYHVSFLEAVSRASERLSFQRVPRGGDVARYPHAPAVILGSRNCNAEHVVSVVYRTPTVTRAPEGNPAGSVTVSAEPSVGCAAPRDTGCGSTPFSSDSISTADTCSVLVSSVSVVAPAVSIAAVYCVWHKQTDGHRHPSLLDSEYDERGVMGMLGFEVKRKSRSSETALSKNDVMILPSSAP
jgi:hypothetical protein